MVGALALSCSGAVAGESPAETKFWQVPWEKTRPRDPDVDAQGKVWFVGQTGDYVARFDPATENFQRFELDPGTGPHNLIAGEDGFIWYAGNRAAHIGRLDPKTGAIEKIAMPDPAVRDPHTLIGDGRGHIWFTVQGSNYVGRLTISNRKVEVLQPATARALPYGIVLDASGRPWLNLLGTHKLATVNPKTLLLEEIEIPRADARSRRIGIDSDGAIWYVDYTGGYLGRVDSRTRAIEEWLAPAGKDARPYAMAIDDRNRVWFVETGPQPNHLIAFDPRSRRFVVDTVLADARGAVRHMVFHRPTRTFWFGTDSNFLARVRLID